MRSIFTISDWAKDTLRVEQFRVMVEGYAKKYEDVSLRSIQTGTSPLEAGFLAQELSVTTAKYGRPNETVIHIHIEKPEYETSAVVPKTLVILLKSGVYVCGQNLEHVFSFLKSEIEEVFEYPGLNMDTVSQRFENSARLSAHLADYLEDELDLRETSSSEIIDLDREVRYVAHVGADGTVVTTYTVEDLKGKKEVGDKLIVKSGEINFTAMYTQEMTQDLQESVIVAPSVYGPLGNPYLRFSGVDANYTKSLTHLKPGAVVDMQ